MQSMNAMGGDQPQQFYMGTPIDPNLVAFQHALLGCQPKNVYQQAIQAQQIPQVVFSHQTMLQQIPTTTIPHIAHLPIQKTTISRAVAIPDINISVEEPIEAGSLKCRSLPYSEDKHSYLPRNSQNWESMTDDEREVIQRQKRKEDAFKTALCDAFKRNGVCPYGDVCRFAHGENELRMPSQPRGKAHPKYKTQLCDKFSTYGQCPYGPRCQFIHKLKGGLPFVQYKQAVEMGEINPASDEENVNHDDSAYSIQRNQFRRRDLSDSGYDGGKCQIPSNSSRKNLILQLEQYDTENEKMSSKVVYPTMQVVNIEMATSSKKSYRRSLPSVIDHADYTASMAKGKIFGKPENIRTYSAMIRASEETTDKSINLTSKEKNFPPKKDLSLIREEETLVEGTQRSIPTTAVALKNSHRGTAINPESLNNKLHRSSSQKLADSNATTNMPWYEKLFGKKMTVIRDESGADESSLQNDMTSNGVESD